MNPLDIVVRKSFQDSFATTYDLVGHGYNALSLFSGENSSQGLQSTMLVENTGLERILEIGPDLIMILENTYKIL
jgi:hypothetical protein